MTTIKRAVASVTVVSLFAFVALSLFIHPGFLFLLTIPGAVITYGALGTWKPRMELPSACCTCGGLWGPWGSIKRYGQYSTIDDYTTKYTQVRSCKECGYAESRRVA